jgi:hypothetical protein
MSNVYVHFSQISFPARYSVVNFQLVSHSLRFREVIADGPLSNNRGIYRHQNYMINYRTFIQKNQYPKGIVCESFLLNFGSFWVFYAYSLNLYELFTDF